MPGIRIMTVGSALLLAACASSVDNPGLYDTNQTSSANESLFAETALSDTGIEAKAGECPQTSEWVAYKSDSDLNYVNVPVSNSEIRTLQQSLRGMGYDQDITGIPDTTTAGNTGHYVSHFLNDSEWRYCRQGGVYREDLIEHIAAQPDLTCNGAPRNTYLDLLNNGGQACNSLQPTAIKRAAQDDLFKTVVTAFSGAESCAAPQALLTAGVSVQDLSEDERAYALTHYLGNADLAPCFDLLSKLGYSTAEIGQEFGGFAKYDAKYGDATGRANCSAAVLASYPALDQDDPASLAGLRWLNEQNALGPRECDGLTLLERNTFLVESASRHRALDWYEAVERPGWLAAFRNWPDGREHVSVEWVANDGVVARMLQDPAVSRNQDLVGRMLAKAIDDVNRESFNALVDAYEDPDRLIEDDYTKATALHRVASAPRGAYVGDLSAAEYRTALVGFTQALLDKGADPNALRGMKDGDEVKSPVATLMFLPGDDPALARQMLTAMLEAGGDPTAETTFRGRGTRAIDSASLLYIVSGNEAHWEVVQVAFEYGGFPGNATMDEVEAVARSGQGAARERAQRVAALFGGSLAS